MGNPIQNFLKHLGWVSYKIKGPELNININIYTNICYMFQNFNEQNPIVDAYPIARYVF